MSTPLYTVQQQIYIKLSTDTTLNAIVSGRVYDGVPENTVFPYVEIGEYVEKPWNTFTRQGKQTELTIYIYSRFKENSELFNIRNAVDAILDKKSLTLTGHVLVGLRLLDARTLQDNQGDVTRIQVITYELWTQEA